MTDRVDRAIAMEIHRGRRGCAFFLGPIALALIWWWGGWSAWAFVVPVILWLYAFIEHLVVVRLHSED
jgi:membrane protein YdbS with pleckstrin-like domain